MIEHFWLMPNIV